MIYPSDTTKPDTHTESFIVYFQQKNERGYWEDKQEMFFADNKDFHDEVYDCWHCLHRRELNRQTVKEPTRIEYQ